MTRQKYASWEVAYCATASSSWFGSVPRQQQHCATSSLQRLEMQGKSQWQTSCKRTHTCSTHLNQSMGHPSPAAVPACSYTQCQAGCSRWSRARRHHMAQGCSCTSRTHVDVAGTHVTGHAAAVNKCSIRVASWSCSRLVD